MTNHSTRNPNKQTSNKSYERPDRFILPSAVSLFKSQPYIGMARAAMTKDTAYRSLSIADLVIKVTSLVNNTLMSGKTKEAIDTAAAELGFDSGISAADIEGYLEAGVSAYAIYLTMQRVASCYRSVTQEGRPLFITGGGAGDSLLTTVPTNGYEVELDPDNVFSAAPSVDDFSPLGLDELGINSINWETLWVSPVSRIRLPQNLKSLLDILFSKYHFNPYARVESYFAFWPDAIINTDNIVAFQTAFNAAMTTLDGYAAGDPEFNLMLDFLGFTKFEFNPFRVKAGNAFTKCVSTDINMIIALSNAQIHYSDEIGAAAYEAESDYTWYSPVSAGSVFSHPNRVQVDLQPIKLSLVLQGCVKASIVHYLETDGTILHRIAFPIGDIEQDDITAAHGSTSAEQFSLSASYWLASYNLPWPYFIVVVVAADGIANTMTMNTSTFFDGFKGIYLGEEMSSIQLIAQAELLWGGEYFESMRKLIESVSSKNRIYSK